MPQADEELRTWARSKFGNIDNHGPEQLLKNAGYTLTAKWYWRLPEGKKYEDMTEDEKKAVVFLIDEWDFGGLTYEDTNSDPSSYRNEDTKNSS